ncbi:MAG: 50S ribosomal protein L2 [Parcubacteria group bacterium GW2011_GWA2_31_28]|nr:MAG: 50S ribosomal protein L2 [Parcubacteria group bacterium GW2011_GWA2_31_28]
MEKSLIKNIKYSAGRSHGKISVRHKGGRVKRNYRMVDFVCNRFDIPAVIKSIEYDPYRSSNIALICYIDGRKSYILAPNEIKIGDKIMSSNKKISFDIGNRMPLEVIPSGTAVHNIQIKPEKNGTIVRSAGTSAEVLSGDNPKWVQVKLPSGEVRLFNKKALATIGKVSNADHFLRTIGKAGIKRKMGVRPTVRGVAMSPYAHPHGGGEGRTGTGGIPQTPWGKLAHGGRTRKKKKYSNMMIIKRRK